MTDTLALLPYTKGRILDLSGNARLVFATAERSTYEQVKGEPDASVDLIYAPQHEGSSAEHFARVLKLGGFLCYGAQHAYRRVTGETPWQEVTEEELPHPNIGLVQMGGHGDALWVSGIVRTLKQQGYHVTLYTEPRGEEVLRCDPHIDRIVAHDPKALDFPETGRNDWQFAYWMSCGAAHDRFLSCIGAYTRFLPGPHNADFYLPHEQRAKLLRGNYVQGLHEWVDIGYSAASAPVRFYASEEEQEFAAEIRAMFDRPLVLINHSGSTPGKWWPYAQECADALAAGGCEVLIVGELRGQWFKESEHVHRIGQRWELRQVLALAQRADAVIGVESVLVNAVAFERSVAKFVLLSHSTHENLCRDWPNTVSFMPHKLACYPCHRNHFTLDFCTPNEQHQTAECMARETADVVVRETLRRVKMKDAA